MRRNYLPRLAVVAIFLLGLAGVSLGQRTTQLVGRITDPSGSVIPSAAIDVTNVDTGVQRKTTSNELGYYTVPLLPPGSYRITVQKEGFRPISRSGITLVVDQAARIDFVMELGAVTETIQVTANVSDVDTQTVTLKAVVDERRIRELEAENAKLLREKGAKP